MAQTTSNDLSQTVWGVASYASSGERVRQIYPRKCSQQREWTNYLHPLDLWQPGEDLKRIEAYKACVWQPAVNWNIPPPSKSGIQVENPLVNSLQILSLPLRYLALSCFIFAFSFLNFIDFHAVSPDSQATLLACRIPKWQSLRASRSLGFCLAPCRPRTKSVKAAEARPSL